MAKIGTMPTTGPGLSAGPLPGVPHFPKMAAPPKPRNNLTMTRLGPPRRLGIQSKPIKPDPTGGESFE